MLMVASLVAALREVPEKLDPEKAVAEPTMAAKVTAENFMIN